MTTTESWDINSKMIELVLQESTTSTLFENVDEDIKAWAGEDIYNAGELASRFLVVIDDDGKMAFMHHAILNKLQNDPYYARLKKQLEEKGDFPMVSKTYFKHPNYNDMERLLMKFNNIFEYLQDNYPNHVKLKHLLEQRDKTVANILIIDMVEYIFNTDTSYTLFPYINNEMAVRGKSMYAYFLKSGFSEEITIDEKGTITVPDVVKESLRLHSYYAKLMDILQKQGESKLIEWLLVNH